MESVGVRELRQNASKLLDRVAGGETFVITSHGREVAHLVPPRTPAAMTRQEMIEQGLVMPGAGDVLAVQPMRDAASSTQEILDGLRADRV